MRARNAQKNDSAVRNVELFPAVAVLLPASAASLLFAVDDHAHVDVHADRFFTLGMRTVLAAGVLQLMRDRSVMGLDAVVGVLGLGIVVAVFVLLVDALVCGRVVEFRLRLVALARIQRLFFFFFSRRNVLEVLEVLEVFEVLVVFVVDQIVPVRDASRRRRCRGLRRRRRRRIRRRSR